MSDKRNNLKSLWAALIFAIISIVAGVVFVKAEAYKSSAVVYDTVEAIPSWLKECSFNVRFRGSECNAKSLARYDFNEYINIADRGINSDSALVLKNACGGVVDVISDKNTTAVHYPIGACSGTIKTALQNRIAKEFALKEERVKVSYDEEKEVLIFKSTFLKKTYAPISESITITYE